MERISEEEAFAIARALIEEHGAAVATFINAKVSSALEAVDFEQILKWNTVRNAIAISLRGSTARH